MARGKKERRDWKRGEREIERDMEMIKCVAHLCDDYVYMCVMRTSERERERARERETQRERERERNR